MLTYYGHHHTQQTDEYFACVWLLLNSPLPKSSSSLLVHLCPRRHAVHRHEEDLARLDDPEENLQVMEDIGKDFLLGNAEVDILVVRVGTLVDDPVHVQIEIVKFWNLNRERKMK